MAAAPSIVHEEPSLQHPYFPNIVDYDQTSGNPRLYFDWALRTQKTVTSVFMNKSIEVILNRKHPYSEASIGNLLDQLFKDCDAIHFKNAAVMTFFYIPRDINPQDLKEQFIRKLQEWLSIANNADELLHLRFEYTTPNRRRSEAQIKDGLDTNFALQYMPRWAVFMHVSRATPLSDLLTTLMLPVVYKFHPDENILSFPNMMTEAHTYVKYDCLGFLDYNYAHTRDTVALFEAPQIGDVRGTAEETSDTVTWTATTMLGSYRAKTFQNIRRYRRKFNVTAYGLHHKGIPLELSEMIEHFVNTFRSMK